MLKYPKISKMSHCVIIPEKQLLGPFGLSSRSKRKMMEIKKNNFDKSCSSSVII